MHGTDSQGATIFTRKIRRHDLLAFFEKLDPCLVGMEACGSSHYWAREISSLGHEVRILPAQRVKPFVIRGKTDATDAAAINTALRQPGIRAVPIKTAGPQAYAMLMRTRSLFVRQKANAVNALRGHLAEFGLVAETGVTNVGKLAAALKAETDRNIPPSARFVLDEIFSEIDLLTARIKTIDARIASEAKKDDDVQRLTSIPGIGTLIASTIKAHVPDPNSFKSARHFASSLGLTPRSNSTGGKSKQTRISKMGNRELRSLLYIAAVSVLIAVRRYGKGSPWQLRLLERRPFKVAAVALANKTARVVWALLTKGGCYRKASELAQAS